MLEVADDFGIAFSGEKSLGAMQGAGAREPYGTKSTIAVKMRTTTTPDSNIDRRTVKF